MPERERITYYIPKNSKTKGLIFGKFKFTNAVQAGLVTYGLISLINLFMGFNLEIINLYAYGAAIAVGAFFLYGIRGESVLNFGWGMIEFLISKRKMSFRRLKYKNEEEE